MNGSIVSVILFLFPFFFSLSLDKIDGISDRSVPHDLEKIFSKYGKVGDVYIPMDYYSK